MSAPSQTRLWTALATVYVVWGSTYLGIRVMVETVPPWLGAGTRFALAGLVLTAGIALTKGAAALRVTGRQLGATALVGALLLVGGNGLVVYAEQTVTSSLAALVVASVPILVVAMRWATGDRPSRPTLIGVGVGFAGLVLLLQPGSGTGIGTVLLFAASTSWALGSFVSPRLPLPPNPLVSTAWEMTLGGLALCGIGLVTGELDGFSFGDISGASAAAWLYLLVVGSLVGFTAYVWLLQRAPISLVATYAYVNPAIAVVLGAVILGETLTPLTAIGGLAVIGSVAAVVTAESLRPAPAARPLPRPRPREHCGSCACASACDLSAAAGGAAAGAAPAVGTTNPGDAATRDASATARSGDAGSQPGARVADEADAHSASRTPSA